LRCLLMNNLGSINILAVTIWDQNLCLWSYSWSFSRTLSVIIAHIGVYTITNRSLLTIHIQHHLTLLGWVFNLMDI
jgi:hypothetical protein